MDGEDLHVPLLGAERGPGDATLAPPAATADTAESADDDAVSATTLWADGSELTPPDGVHLSVLAELLATAAPGASTGDVCRDVVLPRTAAGRCALLETLRGRTCCTSGAPLVGPATVFISHSWRAPFATAVAVCESIAAEEAVPRRPKRVHLLRRRRARRRRDSAVQPPVYFWFDLVTNNQHGTEARPFQWWCTTFTQSVGAIGRVALVLTPWESPIPLTRVWCLWEIFSSFVSNADLSVHLPPEQEQSFLRALVEQVGGGRKGAKGQEGRAK